MANTFSPNGLVPVRNSLAGSWTAQQTKRLIAAANPHTFFQGDLVVSLNTGYIDLWTTASTVQAAGVFMGCNYISTAQSRRIWSNQFPGGDTTVDVVCYIIDDPNTVFRVWVGTGASSAAGGPGVLADVQNNIDFRKGTGSTLSGLSGGYADYATKQTTTTLPLKILGLVQDPPGMNGTDITTAGNIIEVKLNFADLNSATGI